MSRKKNPLGGSTYKKKNGSEPKAIEIMNPIQRFLKGETEPLYEGHEPRIIKFDSEQSNITGIEVNGIKHIPISKIQNLIEELFHEQQRFKVMSDPIEQGYRQGLEYSMNALKSLIE